MKLISKKQDTIKLDASQYTYGKLCAKIASILLGKYNVFYAPNKLTGSVTISNLDQIKFSGKNKTTQIKHYTHSGYAGGFKKVTLDDYMKKDKLIDYLRISIYKMMPKTHHTRCYIYRQVKMEENKTK